jgi:hypothetical protein
MIEWQLPAAISLISLEEKGAFNGMNSGQKASRDNSVDICLCEFDPLAYIFFFFTGVVAHVEMLVHLL